MTNLDAVYVHFQDLFDQVREFLDALDHFENNSKELVEKLSNHLKQVQVVTRVPTDALKINSEFVDLKDRLQGKILARANNFYAMLHQSAEKVQVCDTLSNEREQALQTLQTLPDPGMSLVGLLSTSRPRIDHLISWSGDVLEVCHQFQSNLSKWLDMVSEFCQNPDRSQDKTLQDVLSDESPYMNYETKQELQDLTVLTGNMLI
ncbi:uncharacterized protein LOC131887691 [Tigriopus californicus]|uniref:uncharacterized protein LOC131887691 n=1 Tax=Tigriopus californicus TaxID=6832 RepID=UPI0027DAB1BC|nr:uncharacterized protein LOC131887691 [Tigriopus californicus]